MNANAVTGQVTSNDVVKPVTGSLENVIKKNAGGDNGNNKVGQTMLNAPPPSTGERVDLSNKPTVDTSDLSPKINDKIAEAILNSKNSEKSEGGQSTIALNSDFGGRVYRGPRESNRRETQGINQIRNFGINRSTPQAERIAQAARELEGKDTSRGPDGGANACAWVVDKVLNQAGLQSVPGNKDWCPHVARELAKVSDVTEVNYADMESIPEGSIVFPGGLDKLDQEFYAHIGIFDGEILSNSSSKKQFIWRAGENDNSWINAYGTDKLTVMTPHSLPEMV